MSKASTIDTASAEYRLACIWPRAGDGDDDADASRASTYERLVVRVRAHSLYVVDPVEQWVLPVYRYNPSAPVSALTDFWLA